MPRILETSELAMHLVGIHVIVSFSRFRATRIGVRYEAEDAEALVHFLRFFCTFQEQLLIHNNELPTIIFDKKKRTARQLLTEFERITERERHINGRITVRFEHRTMTRPFLLNYLENLSSYVDAERASTNGIFGFDPHHPLLLSTEYSAALLALRHIEEIQALYTKLLTHFPDASELN